MERVADMTRIHALLVLHNVHEHWWCEHILQLHRKVGLKNSRAAFTN
jgi:hypothetical protein